MARAISRIALGRGGPRDILTLGRGLNQGEYLAALFVRSENDGVAHNTAAALNTLSLSDKGELANGT